MTVSTWLYVSKDDNFKDFYFESSEVLASVWIMDDPHRHTEMVEALDPLMGKPVDEAVIHKIQDAIARRDYHMDESEIGAVMSFLRDNTGKTLFRYSE